MIQQVSHRGAAAFFSLIFLFLLQGPLITPAFSQVEAPARESLFSEDTRAQQLRRQQQVEAALKTDAPVDDTLDFNAPEVQFRQETDEIIGSGGVVISRGGLQLEAEEAVVNVETEEAVLDRDILITGPRWLMSADSASMNLQTETGRFRSARFTLEEGNYDIRASEVIKHSETSYSLFDCSFTTCHCPDGKIPWQVKASEAQITQESYAYLYNTQVQFYGVPLVYTPFFAFPVLEQRTSGILVPNFGYGSRDGVQFNIPYYHVINDHSDALINPFIETKTRHGAAIDYRQAFGERHSLSSRFIYSNERPRDGDLRGTIVSDIFDPTIDDDRFGGYYLHEWRGPRESPVAMSAIADLRYVSDNLLIRELEDSDIADRRSRYVTSTAVGRANYAGALSTEVRAEYNQSMQRDQDLVFQRLPELTVTGLNNYRPFGYNPYGLRLLSRANLSAVHFSREEGYDGVRTDINPVFRTPFYYRNYLNSEVELGLRQTNYWLDDTSRPGTDGEELSPEGSRSLLNVGYTVSTALERIYDVPRDSVLRDITSARVNPANRLVRVRHTIEPRLRYTYVPQTFQDDLPVFDSIDRIRERSLFTYELRSSLFGRFLPDRVASDPVPTLTPYVDELPPLRLDGALEDIGEERRFAQVGNIGRVSRGEIRELATFRIRQSYDYLQDQRRDDNGRSAFSDIGTELGLFPSRNFGMSLESNFNPEDVNLTSWSVATHARRQRGDAIRGRFTYIENNISQLEANLELVLTDRVKLGYYTRYDDLENDFIENRVGLRLISGCNCWSMDLGLSDRINPDRTRFLLNFTFTGLGDISQEIGIGGGNS